MPDLCIHYKDLKGAPGMILIVEVRRVKRKAPRFTCRCANREANIAVDPSP